MACTLDENLTDRHFLLSHNKIVPECHGTDFRSMHCSAVGHHQTYYALVLFHDVVAGVALIGPLFAVTCRSICGTQSRKEALFNSVSTTRSLWWAWISIFSSRDKLQGVLHAC